MVTHREFLERNVNWRADETALSVVERGENLTYAGFNERVNRVANALRDRGVRPGDRVAMILRNTVEFPVVLYGCHKIGAVAVPLNYMLATDDFAYIFDDMHPSTVVYGAEAAGAVETAADRAVEPPRLIRVGSAPTDGERYSNVVESASTADPPEVTVMGGDPSYFLYTSGTTGAPKGVRITVNTATARVKENIASIGLASDSVVLQLSPWFHAGGIDVLVHPLVATGGRIVVTTDWEPESAAGMIDRYGVTHIVTVPTVARGIANLDDLDEYDFSTIECLMCMGSPLSSQLARDLVANVTPNVYNGYGTTESLLDTALRPEDLPEHAGTAGRPTHDKQVRVIEFDPDRDVRPDETAPVGEEGEVIVKGDPVMDGYYGSAEATAEALREGWYYTKDLGVIDGDGYLTVTGRADDMILSGGELVSPIEVEETLEEFEGVEAAVVVGRPDEKWGERVAAFVVADDGVTAGDLEAFCEGHESLADYKRPREYEFVAELERTATGKKQRYKYRD